MTTPHTDIEVLDGALEILERDGMWCQGAYYYIDEGGQKLSFCAEGAIREAAGYWNVVQAKENPEFPGRVDSLNWQYIDLINVEPIHDQCAKLENMVLANSDNQANGLNGFNDDEHTTVGDVLLAMKKTREEIANAVIQER